MSFNKKTFLAIFGILFLGLLLPLNSVLAQWSILGDIFNKIGGLITAIPSVFTILVLFVVFLISSLFPILTSVLINWVINLDILLTRCAVPNTCAVDVGWAFTRDLANMFFILFLVIIAFATILGIESYGMRRLLPVLIIVALLINFSQLLVGVIVDFFNVLTKFIFGKIDTQVFTDIASSKASEIIKKFTSDLGTFLNLTGQIGFILQIVIMILFNFILGFVLLIFFLIFFLRIPMLWMLTIMAPISFVCAIIPFTKNKFSEWMKNVIEWSMIGFWAGLYLYLGTFVLNAGISTSLTSAPGTLLATYSLTSMIEGILPYAVALAFLALGAMTAFSTNAMFSGAIVSAGAGVYNKYLSPTSLGKRTVSQARSYAKKPVKALEKKGVEMAAEAGRKIPWLPFRRKVEEKNIELKKEDKKKIDEASEGLGKMEGKTRYDVIKDTYFKGKKVPGMRTSNKDAAAFVKATAEEGDEDKIVTGMTAGEKDRYEEVKRRGLLHLRDTDSKLYEDTLKKSPHWALADPVKGTTAEEEIRKSFGTVSPNYIKEGKFGKESYEYLETARSTNRAHAEDIVKDMSAEKFRSMARIEDEKLRERAQRITGEYLRDLKARNELKGTVKTYLDNERGKEDWAGYI